MIVWKPKTYDVALLIFHFNLALVNNKDLRHNVIDKEFKVDIFSMVTKVFFFNAAQIIWNGDAAYGPFLHNGTLCQATKN
jgi:hypothetical protein